MALGERRVRGAMTALAAVSCLLLADAAYGQCTAVNPVVAPAITFTGTPLAPEFYFRDNGTPTLLLGTNPTGYQTAHFDELFGYATGNERILRIHLTNGKRQFPAAAGSVDCAWLAFWDDVFTRAETNGLYVIPVFDVWADWTTTLGGTQNWAHNFYNSAAVICDPMSIDYKPGVTCGPATDPLELVTSGSAAQSLWLGWLATLVQHWQNRPNVIAWEVFSELNLINNGTTTATEANAVAFAEAAADVIRTHDTSGRPVMASRAGDVTLWPTLINSTRFEFIQTHPYAEVFGGDLDDFVIDQVRTLRANYGKPVFIGEIGLDSRKPVDTLRMSLINPSSVCPGTPQQTCTMSGNAPIAINQAIWAGAVSGALNARMLWFEDGYDRYHAELVDVCAYTQFAAYAECADGDPATVLTLRAIYANASAPVAAFVQGVDYDGFAPVGVTMGSADITGAALGDNDLVLGWIKDVQSAAANDWVVSASLSGETVTVDVPGSSADWLVDFYDTMDPTGTILQTIDADQDPSAGDDITFTLPGFTGSIAFKVYSVGALPVTIDVIPAGSRNRINMTAPNPTYVPVAILGAIDFDPTTTIDAANVQFGPAGVTPAAWDSRDVNGDGFPDLRMAFLKSATGFTCRGIQPGDLTGETVTGRTITGSDTVRILGAGLPPC